MEIVLHDMRHGYRTLIDRVLSLGEHAVARDLATYEITGALIVFPEAATRLNQMLPIGIGRRVNVTLAHVEALSLIAGVWPEELITNLAPHYADVLETPDDQHQVAYGPRVRVQLLDVVRTLTSDATSRRAVVQIWGPSDLNRVGDRPCTLSIQFMIRRDALQMHVTMRSQDVWLGAAMDMFVFTQLQYTLANVLDIEVGKYCHTVGSLHLYTRDLPALTRVYAASHMHVSDQDGSNHPRGLVIPNGVNHNHERILWAVSDARALLNPLSVDHQRAAERNPAYRVTRRETRNEEEVTP